MSNASPRREQTNACPPACPEKNIARKCTPGWLPAVSPGPALSTNQRPTSARTHNPAHPRAVQPPHNQPKSTNPRLSWQPGRNAAGSRPQNRIPRCKKTPAPSRNTHLLLGRRPRRGLGHDGRELPGLVVLLARRLARVRGQHGGRGNWLILACEAAAGPEVSGFVQSGAGEVAAAMSLCATRFLSSALASARDLIGRLRDYKKDGHARRRQLRGLGERAHPPETNSWRAGAAGCRGLQGWKACGWARQSMCCWAGLSFGCGDRAEGVPIFRWMVAFTRRVAELLAAVIGWWRKVWPIAANA